VTAERRSRTTEDDAEVEIGEFYAELREAAKEVGEFIGEQMSERPYATLAAATAMGYALGIPRGAAGLLAGLYSRMALGWLENLFAAPPQSSAMKRNRTR
jgi:hypothetical protein